MGLYLLTEESGRAFKMWTQRQEALHEWAKREQIGAKEQMLMAASGKMPPEAEEAKKR